MDFHIGELIRERAKTLRIGPTELGAKIETSKQNVYGIFKRRSIDTELLAKICKALEHDFFVDISKSLQIIGLNSPPRTSAAADTSDSAALQRELDYVRRINILLEENNSHLKSEVQKLKS